MIIILQLTIIILLLLLPPPLTQAQSLQLMETFQLVVTPDFRTSMRNHEPLLQPLAY